MFKYRKGQESRIVVEKEAYGTSIFSNQYRRAFQLINSYLKDDNPDSLRIVSFCGERGAGKTSCMMSVREMASREPGLEILAPGLLEDRLLFYADIGVEAPAYTRFYTPDIIDPSFFDPTHNLLEILMGNLYGCLKEEVKKLGIKVDRSKLRELQLAFEDVKRGIFNLHKDVKEAYSELTELDMLASAVDLKSRVRILFQKFLEFTDKDVMLLSIDDIDLCPHGAYEMCEQIRKYLAIPECIILISVKYEQLENVIATHFWEGGKSRMPNYVGFDVQDMAQRYLGKLLPIGVRITMPTVYDICNQELRVELKDPKNDKFAFEFYPSIRQGIPELIFRKTRYLFYNNKGGISLIVPNNLRQFVALLGLLYSMDEIDEESWSRQEVLKRNAAAFKHYFYQVWTDGLPLEYKIRILQWVNDTSYEALNKSVIMWLNEEFKDELSRKYGEDEGEENTSMQVSAYSRYKNSILNKENFSYNITIGDVFFLLALLELDVQEPSKAKMLFFIRSMYSIALFESYDVDVYDVEHPDGNGVALEESGLYRSDKRFEKTMDLQRLVWGSYFSFMPGELLPNDVRGFHYDTRLINGSSKKDDRISLMDLFKECAEIIIEYDANKCELEELGAKQSNELTQEDKARRIKLEEKIPRQEIVFQMAEFFMLTISRSVRAKNVEDFYDGKDDYRLTSIPAFFSQFNPYMGYFVFNVLAPFYNLINPKYTYDRYSSICTGLYDFACGHKFSLLNQILMEGIKARPHIPHKTIEGQLHCMMSDVVIRNGEVLDAIRENVKSIRSEGHKGGTVEKITHLYNQISTSGMSTHRKTLSGEDDRHRIDFRFLNPLVSFLKSIDKDASESVRNMFYGIFDYVEERQYSRRHPGKTATSFSAASIIQRNPAAILQKRLIDIFGNREIGTADNVMTILRQRYPGKIKGSKRGVGLYLRGHMNNKAIIYTPETIVSCLLEWNDKEKLNNWYDLFDIAHF